MTPPQRPGEWPSDSPQEHAGIRVLVAHRHRGFAEALGERLADETDLEVVATCTEVRQAGVILSVIQPEVLLADWRLSEPDARAEISRFHEHVPSLRVTVIAESDGASCAVDAIRAGVRGWVQTGDPIDRLCDALRGVARGEMWFPPAFVTTAVLELLVDRDDRDESRAILESLTPRELEVLRHLVAGQSRCDIAREMFISPNTVRTHVNNVLHRLGVHDSVAAVAIARRAGLGPAVSSHLPH